MSDRDGKIEPFSINLIPGKTAPRYDASTHELTPLHVAITEQGMQSGRPMVDMVFADANGQRFAFTTSGRMLLMVAAAVQAAVIRGGREPDYVPLVIQAIEGKHPQADAFGKATHAFADAITGRLVTGIQDSASFREAVRLALLDLLRA